MKKTISMMLVCLLVLGALPLSLAVTAESPAAANAEMPITNVRGAADVSPPVRQINDQSIAIDVDPAGGYEGDYVVMSSSGQFGSGASMSPAAERTLPLAGSTRTPRYTSEGCCSLVKK